MLFISLSHYSFSQKMLREIDLHVKKMEPAQITFIKCPTRFQFKLNVVNNGPDTLYASDRYSCYIPLDSSYLFHFDVPGSINPNDSQVIDFEFELPNYNFDRNDLALNIILWAFSPIPGSMKAETQLQYVDNFVIYPNIMIRTATSSINDFSNNALCIYPNPANQFIQLRLPESFNQPNQVTIFNHLGQQVWTGVLLQHEDKIDISPLPNGYYTFRLKSNDVQIFNKSFIIAR